MRRHSLSDGIYVVRWLSIVGQELRHEYLCTFALVGRVFLALDRSEWLSLPPHGEPLDEAGQHRLLVLMRGSSYVEVTRTEVGRLGETTLLKEHPESSIGRPYEVWVGTALFLSRSPAENLGWLRWVASRWWRFGSSATPVFIFDPAGKLSFRCTLGDVPGIVAALDTGPARPAPEAKHEG